MLGTESRCEEKCWTSGPKKSPLNFSYFKMWVDWMINLNDLSFSPKSFDALTKCPKSHAILLRYGSVEYIFGC
jgi:hypothetical protein